jgi:hypothetical protein
MKPTIIQPYNASFYEGMITVRELIIIQNNFPVLDAISFHPVTDTNGMNMSKCVALFRVRAKKEITIPVLADVHTFSIQ